jgi:Ca-activated chloride channel family protein
MLLYPAFLWVSIPLLFLWVKGSKQIATRIHLLILMLLVIALSRPVEEKALQQGHIDAKDIIIALDASYSMRATDIAPTRYDFAKKTINAFLKHQPADNIMLIAFTTNPLLLSPPTTDHTLLSIALETLNLEYILTKGTSLEKLFKKIASLQGGHKNLILITDGGEETAEEKLSVLLQQANVSLITLAMGTKQGTTIANPDGSLLKDKEGNLVISRINPLLETLTHRAGGSYLSAKDTAEQTAKKLSDTLNAQTQEHQQIQKMQRLYQEWYQLPLLLAILLFLMLHTSLVKYLLMGLTLLGVNTQASFLDTYYTHVAYTQYQSGEYTTSLKSLRKIEIPSLQSKLLAANNYYRQGDYTHAIALYKSIRSTSIQTKQQLYYNIANAYAKRTLYGKAKIYYTKALQLGEDTDTLYNLKQILFLEDKNHTSLGMAHPKSQSNTTSKSMPTQAEDKERNSEAQPSSGSGAGGEKSSQKKKTNKQEKNRLIEETSLSKYPLSSKVYELINKGYIRETHPW